ALMKPWSWLPIEAFAVRAFINGNWTSIANTLVPRTWKGAGVSTLRSLQHLRKDLDDEYKQCDADCLVWKPAGGDGHGASALTDPPWHALVGSLSTYPAPIPQYLNLAFMLRVAKDAVGEHVVAVAPVLPAGSPFDTALTPIDAGPEDKGGYHVWLYDKPGVA